MRLTQLAAFWTAAALLATTASAATLTVGDSAPNLTVSKWVKGQPVSQFEPGKIYVVEFWATWCGPCKEAIPHLTALAKKYPDVAFIGASIWEDDDALVEPFVAKMGDKMVYHIAMDDKSKIEKGAMVINWMEASGNDVIPATFLIDGQGKIAWMGEPEAVEEPIKQLIAGTFDVAASKKQAAEALVIREARIKVRKELNELTAPLIKAKNFDAAAAEVDGLIARNPSQKGKLLRAKFNILVRGEKFDLAYPIADEAAAALNDDEEELNALAWYITTNKAVKQRDFDRAVRYSTRAVELTHRKDASLLDTLARVYFEKRDIVKAIEIQSEAVNVASDWSKEELVTTLEKYKSTPQ